MAIILVVLSGAASVTGLYSDQNRAGRLWAVGISVFALIVAVPMRRALVRFSPWAIGLRRTTQ